MTAAKKGVAAWHKVMEGNNKAEDLDEILAENAVFHSPVVHTPQAGKPLVMAYLSAAGQTLGNPSFQYVREIVDGNDALLEFTTEMEGVHVNGVDIIRFNDQGQIEDFKVMIRPLKAVNKVWEMMAAQLQKAKAD